MKFLSTKITQLKSTYKKNKPLGILFALGVGLLCLIFLPELLIFFAPKAIFNQIWSLKFSKAIKILILIPTFLVFGFAVYNLFFFIKGILGFVFGLLF
jgi:hypothetical protein